MALGSLFAGVSNATPTLIRDLSLKLADWYPTYVVALGVATLFCIIGIWRMRSWAFVLYGLIFVLTQGVLMFVGDWNPSNLVLVTIVVGLLIRYYPRTRRTIKSEQDIVPNP